MKKGRYLVCTSLVVAMSGTAAAANMTVKGSGRCPSPQKPSVLTLTTCDYDAHAVCSLKWNNKEFINEWDHGRQMQSAAQFGPGLPNRLTEGENYNPNEAGASHLTNGLVPQASDSVSIAASSSSAPMRINTTTRMAYWFPVNGKTVSNWTLSKDIAVSQTCKTAMLTYKVSFAASEAERHNEFGQFEVLTAYLQPEFYVFSTIDLKGGQELTGAAIDGQEQTLPLIASTADGQYAMGFYNPRLPQAAFPANGYGAWRFLRVAKECEKYDCKTNKTVKINTVERFHNPGKRRDFKVYVFVGTLENVAAEMRARYNAGALD